MSVNIRLRPPSQNLTAESYHTRTKLHPYHFRRWEATLPALYQDPVISRWMQSPFKIYRSAPKRELPPPDKECRLEFSSAFTTSDTPQRELGVLSIEEVSSLLYYSAGLNQEERRPYPSAGSFYPLEIYLEKITDTAEGIHHYNVRNHCLEHIATESSLREADVEAMTLSGTLFYITGVFDRAALRYGDRGYRYVLVETGQVLQNLLLVSRAMGLCAASTCRFLDDRLNRRLNIDGVEEAILSVVSVGREA